MKEPLKWNLLSGANWKTVQKIEENAGEKGKQYGKKQLLSREGEGKKDGPC